MRKIRGISGATVRIDGKGLKLYEMVFVGDAGLTGEVVKIYQDMAIVQVYEDTHGLGIGERVESTGKALTVQLGPGLLSGIFDGLQKPLDRLGVESGPFIRPGSKMHALDLDRKMVFYPMKKEGDGISPGEVIGYVEEGPFRNLIPYTGSSHVTISSIVRGEFCLREPVAELQNGNRVYGFHEWPVRVPKPYARKLPPSDPILTGQRCIDFLFPLAKGGTAVLPGGFGTGKTILEQSIAKYSDVDIVVYAGCGERGNEMAEMIEQFELLEDPVAGRKLLERTILCVNTSNMPVAAREASIYTAITMAEFYRDMGFHVLFLADSISRWAEALREISSSLEEMPGEEGYPTYLASRMSGFLERAGVVESRCGRTGSLSIVLAVSPPGGDFTEPVTQSCLRTTGAFIMLDTSLAHRRHFPAINWSQSYSLYEQDLSKHFRETISPDWEETQTACRTILQKEEALREVVEIVGLEGLQDEDRLMMHTAERIRLEFLCQNAYTEDAFSSSGQTILSIRRILDFHRAAVEKLREGAPIAVVLSQKKGETQ